jgi:DNA-binding transcriptional LysR family regulator
MVWTAGWDFDLKSTIAPGDLRGLPVISNPAPEPQHRMIMEWFRSDGFFPLSISTCTSVAVISELVAANVGLSLLPVSLIRPLAENGRVRILGARPATPLARIFCAFHASDRGANIDAILRSIHVIVRRVAFAEQNI